LRGWGGVKRIDDGGIAEDGYLTKPKNFRRNRTRIEKGVGERNRRRKDLKRKTKPKSVPTPGRKKPGH